MFGICIELKTKCKYCSSPLMLNALTEDFSCSSCYKINSFPFEQWQNLLSDGLQEMDDMEVGQGQPSTIMSGEYSYQLLFGRLDPRCNKCKEPISSEIIDVVEDKATVPCTKCGEAIFIRRKPESLHKIFPTVSHLVAEDKGLLTGGTGDKAEIKNDMKPVIFNCPSCGGSLKVDGTDRLVLCTYCDSNVYLPDDLWFRLHPVTEVDRWFMVINEQTLKERLPYWYDLSDAIVDKIGNVYLASEDDDDNFEVWSFGPDRKTRWVNKNLNLDSDNAQLALSHDGNIYIWEDGKISLVKLSSNDGSIISKLQGEEDDENDPTKFHMKECNSMVSMDDGSLLLLRDYKLLRFNENGESIPLWEKEPSVSKGWNFFKKAIGESSSNYGKPLKEIDSYPKLLNHYDDGLNLGWDNHLYICESASNNTIVAKFTLEGELIRTFTFPIRKEGKKAWANKEGDVFVLGKTEEGHTRIMMSTSEGTVKTIISDLLEDGYLEEEDYILLTIDGTIYVLNYYNRLKCFSPELEMVYRSKQSEQSDQECLEDAKKEQKDNREDFD